MEHSFIWTSNDIEGIQDELKCGIEIVDGYLKVYNQNPNREEYLMIDEEMNPEFTGTVTADWITATTETVNNRNYLRVTIINPALDIEPVAEDFVNISNTQIIPGDPRVFMELEVKMHKDMVDPRILEMMRR